MQCLAVVTIAAREHSAFGRRSGCHTAAFLAIVQLLTMAGFELPLCLMKCYTWSQSSQQPVLPHHALSFCRTLSCLNLQATS